MRQTSVGVLLALLSLAACAPDVSTGDEDADQIINRVVDRETWSGKCVEVRTAEKFALTYPDAMPMRAEFEIPEVRAAARAISVPFEEATESWGNSELIQLVGEPDFIDKTGCSMSVSYPQFSGQFAFVSTSSPGGAIKEYALERKGKHWFVAEEVFIGWW